MLEVVQLPKFQYNQSELEEMFKNPWLTERERIVFERYYRDGIHIEDIAAELDPPVNRSTVDRILKNIRNKTIKSI